MPVPVINLAQMRAWEKATWAAGQTEDEVIRRVGKRVARRARRMTRAGDTIVILAGKGHNGEDATAAKLYLDSRKVKLVELLLPASDLIKVEMILREKPALVIDGIFGIGLNRPLSESWQKNHRGGKRRPGAGSGSGCAVGVKCGNGRPFRSGY